jgi:ATP-dependent Clp protease ATP-binding subunit ClpB
VLDDGRLTDGQGRTVDFTNVVLIMTSNLGSQYIDPDLPREVVAERVMAAVREHFRPEFLNRIDDVVVFDKLSPEDLRQIVEIQMESLRERLHARGIDLVATDEALDLLAERGYDPVYGARPLKRVLQRELADPIATAILEGRFGEGDTVKVSVQDGELVLS